MVDHVKRIIDGKNLYIQPSIEFTPLIYTPLYYYISAAASKIFGVGFLPLRLISICASIGNILLIFSITKKETGKFVFGVLGAGLFTATYRFCGAWFDLARCDSLFLFFLLSAVYLLRFYKTNISYFIAGISISLAYLTKQNAIVLVFPAILYLLVTEWKRSLVLILTIISVISISSAYFNIINEGWFNYYVFKLPGQHNVDDVSKTRIYSYWMILFRNLPVAGLFSIYYLYKRGKEVHLQDMFYATLAIGFLLGTWWGWLNPGAFDNTFIPICAIISILFPISVLYIFKKVTSGQNIPAQLSSVVVLSFCILQFTILLYNPLHQIPSVTDEKAGKKLISIISSYKGPRFIPGHGYLNQIAGGKNYAHTMAIFDISRTHKDNPYRGQLKNEIDEKLKHQEFATVVLDNNIDIEIRDTLKKYYKVDQTIRWNDDAFFPVTGYKTRPNEIYIPR